MTHITGGGFYENIPRALPEGVTAKVDTTSFPTLPIFDWLQQQGEIETNLKCIMFLIWVSDLQLSLKHKMPIKH